MIGGVYLVVMTTIIERGIRGEEGEGLGECGSIYQKSGFTFRPPLTTCIIYI